MSKMKIKDLEFEQLVGKRYKNWKQFCEDNNVTYNNASSNIKAQKQELERYCKIKWIDKKEFIIKEVYAEPKEKKRKPKKSKYSHIPTTKGVYYIVDNDRDIYVGSTNVSFRERYGQHTQKDNPCTSKVIISKEHTFGVLYDMTNIEDVELIRMIEDEYINYFSNNAEYNLLNKRDIKTIEFKQNDAKTKVKTKTKKL